MCFEKLSKKIKKFSCLDISLIKLSVFAFALMIAKLLPQILSLDWFVYAIIFVIAGIPPTIKMFK